MSCDLPTSLKEEFGPYLYCQTCYVPYEDLDCYKIFCRIIILFKVMKIKESIYCVTTLSDLMSGSIMK